MLNTIDSNEPTLFHARSRDLEEDSSSNMMVSRPLAEVRTRGSEVDGGAGPRRPSVSRPRRLSLAGRHTPKSNHHGRVDPIPHDMKFPADAHSQLKPRTAFVPISILILPFERLRRTRCTTPPMF